MIIYIVVFIIVYILAYVADRYKENHNVLKVLLLCITLILTIFSGLRNENVGTDVLVYVKPILFAMNNYGFVHVLNTANVEVLFVILSWISSLITSEIFGFLTLIQLIIHLFVFMFCYSYKDKISIYNFVLIYVTVFYGITFNLMRQSIAIAIVIYSYKYIEKDDVKKYILLMIIAMNFHITAIIGLITYIIYKLNQKKIGLIVKYVIISGLIIAILFIEEIISISISLGILPDKFSIYITKYINEGFDIQITAEILKIIFMLLCYYLCKLDNRSNRNYISTMKFLIVVGFLLFQLGARIIFVERLSYYFSILTYLLVLSKGNKIVKNQLLYDYILFLLLFGYWYVTYVYLGVSAIIPYSSNILGI